LFLGKRKGRMEGAVAFASHSQSQDQEALPGQLAMANARKALDLDHPARCPLAGRSIIILSIQQAGSHHVAVSSNRIPRSFLQPVPFALRYSSVASSPPSCSWNPRSYSKGRSWRYNEVRNGVKLLCLYDDDILKFHWELQQLLKVCLCCYFNSDKIQNKWI
jgi:hypothetical protein